MKVGKEIKTQKIHLMIPSRYAQVGRPHLGIGKGHRATLGYSRTLHGVAITPHDKTVDGGTDLGGQSGIRRTVTTHFTFDTVEARHIDLSAIEFGCNDTMMASNIETTTICARWKYLTRRIETFGTHSTRTLRR